MTIPYTFAGATTAIPLANLDANFASPITLGNVAMTLSNTYNSIGNLTLTNVTISSASGLAANTVAYANASGVLGGSANMTFNGTTLTLANDASISGLTVGKGGGAVSSNTAFGANALTNSTGSSYGVTGFGYYALAANTSGNSIVGIGANALTSNTTGSALVAIGHEALKFNTTASNNTAVGYQAGYSNTTGASCVFVGTQAGYSTQSSAYNTFVGFQAGYTYNFNGDGYNTAIGRQAGYALTTGLYNLFVGANAGNSITTGSNNTIVGSVNAGQQITTGSKNTLLGGYNGNQGGLDIRTASNNIVLSDGDGNPRQYCDTGGAWYIPSGNFSFGDGSAQALISLLRTGTSSYAMHRYWSAGSELYRSGLINDGTNRFYVCSAGNANGVYLASNAATSWTSNSDERNKDIIEPITNAANKVSSLRAVIGKYKKDVEGTRRSFLIAQDVQAVLPEAVDASVPENLGVQYTDVIPLLVAAIQELNAKVTALEAQLGAK